MCWGAVPLVRLQFNRKASEFRGTVSQPAGSDFGAAGQTVRLRAGRAQWEAEPGPLIAQHWGSSARGVPMEELFSEETLAKARTAKIYIEHLYKVQSQNVKERRDR